MSRQSLARSHLNAPAIFHPRMKLVSSRCHGWRISSLKPARAAAQDKRAASTALSRYRFIGILSGVMQSLETRRP
jgi:hypothetical protein